ncbi:MAG: hypothetical protein MJ214_05265 [Bacilli bacterium]|nr:hypothetical protein [Bacilli bacterium]
MAKKIVTSNIQDNHTLGEYQRYFSHLLKKGKLKRFSLKEKDQLNPTRQYWKITDEKGETYYYELPKYIKPSYTKSAYSMKRVMHRRPARVALAIFAGAAFLSFTSMVVGKSLNSSFPDIPPQPQPDPKGLFEKMKNFQDWQKENPDADATTKYMVSDLITIGMANTLYDDQQYEVSTATYPRRSLLTVGFGSSKTTVIPGVIEVSVNISNAFIFQNGDALEESISYSDNIMAPRVGRRDFYTHTSDEDGRVDSNTGDATSPTTISDNKWHSEFDRQYDNKAAYEEKAGKIPDNPFLYSIDEETVLSDSTATKIDGGYNIDINLDTVKGVARYVRRMTYLSGKTPTKFYNVKLHFTTDDNLHIISSGVNESYDVESALYTIGSFATNFYYGEKVPNIPDPVTPFDYSPYK